MLGRVKVRNEGTYGPKCDDTIHMTLILVKIDIESPKTAPISMKIVE